MASKSRASRGNRRNRTFTLNPTTRAIRHVLAMSLVMAVSQPVLAGTCDVSIPSNAVCNGDFFGSNISYAIDDLTIVVGGDLPTVIQPLDGYVGIDLYSATGSISLTTAADIVSSHAAAISVNAPYGDVLVANSGGLQTSYGDGIKARSYDGDVTVSNAGSVDVDFGQRGIEARSGNGDITVDNAAGASITVANYAGNAMGIEARSYYGDISVDNEGVIDASVVYYGNATGIRAYGFYGDVAVTNSDTGVISASTDNHYGGQATGVFAKSTIGASSVSNAGDISASATADYGYNAIATGVRNNGGYYGITSTVNDGTISATANNDDGVAWAWGVRSRGQDVELDNSGLITADAYAYTGYASATASYVRGGYYAGTSHLDNSGDITAHAIVGTTGGRALAYGAMVWGGDASLDNQGNISAYAAIGNGSAVAQGTSNHYNQTSTTNNDGNILADTYAGVGFAASFGVYNYAWDESTVTNGATGTITGVGSVGNGYAFGYGAWLDGGEQTTLTNNGTISGSATVYAGEPDFGTYGAMARSIGASVKSRYAGAYMTNGEYGSISAESDVHGNFGRAYSFGAVVQGYMARAENHGSISADAYTETGYAISLGDMAYGSEFAVNLNYGSLATESTVAGDGFAKAVGQYAFGFGVTTAVNEGTVTAAADVGSGTAMAAGAVAYGAFSASYNYGDMAASAIAGDGDAKAAGVDSFGYFGSSVYNAADATLTATAQAVNGDAMAQGVYNFALIYGANVANDGSITATASTVDGNATALGVLNMAYLGYDAAITVNNGDISAIASSDSGISQALGVYNYAFYSDASVDNSGSITASATGQAGSMAAGISSTSIYGDVLVTNTGDISASAPLGSATGIYANSYYGSAEVINADAATITATGGSSAYGVILYGNEVARLTNYGSIAATAELDAGTAAAYGGAAIAGISVILNYGSITAEATIADAGTALAFGALSSGDAATIVNDGTITATSAVGGDGDAVAMGGYAVGAFNGVYNYGDVTASASTGNGYSYAYGINSFGFNGSNVYNASDSGITSSASTGDGTAVSMGVNSYGFYNADVTNEGSISAAASNTVYGIAVANGVQNVGYLDAAVVNDGNIDATASAYIGLAQAAGVYNVAVIYDADVTNTGSISATASADVGFVYANGVVNISAYYGIATTANSGNISSTANVGYGLAQTEAVFTFGYYGASIDNSGSILATAETDIDYSQGSATAAYAYVVYGDAVIQNHGDINAVATSHGTSYYTYATAKGAAIIGNAFTHNTATLYNDGTISATATVAGTGISNATAAQLSAKYAAETNFGSISAISSAGYGGIASSTGVVSSGKYASSDINYGSIVADATTDKGYAVAHGVIENSYYQGSTTLTNFGDISASTQSAGHVETGYGGMAYSYGVTSLAKYDAIVYNAGSISAVSDAQLGAAKAFGVIMQSAAGSDHDTTYNETSGATLTNNGDIYARANGSGYYALAVGAELGARYSAQTYNNAGGSITAVANGDNSPIPLDSPLYCGATAVGSNTAAWGYAGNATLVNHGDIGASASASAAKACVTGSSVLSAIVGTTDNDGTIGAYAIAVDGLAIARGSATYSLYGDATLSNDGIITAAADAGSAGAAYAYGGLAMGGYGYHASTYNGVDGVIRASAAGGGDTAGAAAAIAVGSITVGGHASLVNYGDIGATATAAGYGDALAMGAVLTGDSAGYSNGLEYFYWNKNNVDSSVYNGGNIGAMATAEDGVALATGVKALSQYGNVTVDNAGSIVAVANGAAGSAAIGVYLGSSYGYNTLSNTGSIVAMGDGLNTAVWSSDDAIATIDNHGTIVGGIRTGALDDTLANHAGATLVLDTATVDLGAHSGAGNAFTNAGTIVVRGASQINMGQGLYTAVPSLNPIAFGNSGVIDFRDGAPDDMLTITGDFAGDGQLYLDVSGLHGASDVLYVDGSVVDGSVHTVNLNLIDMPTTASSAVTVVSVSGDATADSFVLGDVRYGQNNFLALDFSAKLVSTIDASNATADLFSLGVEVTGLSDSGVLAASIAPGAQSLMATQVGTWRQRMGLINQYATNGVGAWARVFQAQGTIAPEQAAANFGQGGHFAFDQKNTGTEVGVDFALSNEFSVGVLLAKAEGTQHLNGGVGSSKLKGDTAGVYATWISPTGFYFDGSYRAMNFTTEMTSVASQVQADGDAASLNFEAGYAWTLAGGLKVEPQLQYTQTHVSSVDVITMAQGTLQVTDGDTSTARLGVMLRKSFGTGTVWTPYASVNAVREFDGQNGYAINDTFFGATSTEGTSALVEGGLSVQAGQLSVSAGLNWQDGGAVQSFVGGQVGLRYTW